ncbi:DUF4132 domain-containing protein [Actinomadura darangshiensis]|uniref:DUF4132 domain-containing protein n=1 Tax=Actinomadura darangshiensis TaxID=705336 RepID=A0A4R5BTD4_9ACTN|nr:DUF4132 domain-containing protein [Actinomadura darangshiensis]TDD88896.1 DUF4132 domain-containing protein [Actinomadura darangshiensis]
MNDLAPASVPNVLVDPPWKEAAKDERAPVVLPDLTPPGPGALAWAEDEQEQWFQLARLMIFVEYSEDDPFWDEARDRFLSGEIDYGHQAIKLVIGPERAFGDLLPLFLERADEPSWQGINLYALDDFKVKPLVAQYGMRVRDLALRAAKRRPVDNGEVLLPYLDVEVARVMVDWLVRLKSARDVGRQWLLRHGPNAVPYLVPDAVGRRRAARDKAAAGLRLIAEEYGRDAVVQAAGVHGDQAAEAVAGLLDAGVAAVPVKEPKIPRWLDVAALPRPGELDDVLVRNLVGLLMLAEEPPLREREALRAACTGLPEFAWAIFEAWRSAGEPNGHAWVLTQLGELGDDETVRRAAPLVRQWIAKRKHLKAARVVDDVLARIGTDAALTQLNLMTRRSFPGGAREDARLALLEAARRRGLTDGQLADRLVPDFGLDADGTLTLDYGPRRFTVGFDEQLKPFVTGEDGRQRKTLPKPGAKDDPELAPDAHRRFAAMKKDVRAIAADQIVRLETAMVTGRRWTDEEFRTFVVAHPLIRHLARRLVWTAGEEPFRIAEDGTFATADDEAYEPPGGAPIGIAHPLHLDVAAWSRLFRDYEILQPFPQLARPVATLDEEARGVRRLARFEGATTSFGAVLRLARQGWERAYPLDSGVEPGIFRAVGEKLHIAVELDPGLVAGEPGAFPEHKIRRVQLVTDLDLWWWDAPDAEDSAAPLFGELDPATVSEILVDLASLRTD